MIQEGILKELKNILENKLLKENDDDFNRAIELFSKLENDNVELLKKDYTITPEQVKQLDQVQREKASDNIKHSLSNMGLIAEHVKEIWKKSKGDEKDKSRRVMFDARAVLGVMQNSVINLNPPKLSTFTIQELFQKGITDPNYAPQDVVHEMIGRMAHQPDLALEHGPFIKSESTFLFEELACLILNQEALTYVEKKVVDPIDPTVFHVACSYIHEPTGQTYDLFKLIHGLNVGHISLPQEFYTKFVAYVHENLNEAFNLPGSSGVPTESTFFELDPEGEHSHLSYAEKLATVLYSGALCSEMNSLLRYDFGSETPGDRALKNAIVSVVLCSSGLNKIPIKRFDYVFRGESGLPKKIVENRKKAMKEGGTTWERGFVSTSYSHGESKFIGDSNVIFTGGMYGQDISKLTEYPDEHEVLLVPTQVEWKGMLTDEKGNIYFHANTVTTLSGLTPEQQQAPQEKFIQKQKADVKTDDEKQMRSKPKSITTSFNTSKQDPHSVIEQLSDKKTPIPKKIKKKD